MVATRSTWSKARHTSGAHVETARSSLGVTAHTEEQSSDHTNSHGKNQTKNKAFAVANLIGMIVELSAIVHIVLSTLTT